MFERPILLWLLLATPLIVWPAAVAARADRRPLLRPAAIAKSSK
jgi:hypothetical protein